MLYPPSRIGDYELEHKLGDGLTADVYRARHSTLGTVHALRLLHRHQCHDDAGRERFLAAARLQAQVLDHPGIMKVTDIVLTDEHAATVMELADGGTLETARHAFFDHPAEVRRIMLGVLDALGHAHGVGIVHRTLEPDRRVNSTICL